MVSRFYAHGITGVLLDWAHNGMTADPEPAVTMLEKLLSSDTVHQILSTQPSLIPPLFLGQIIKSVLFLRICLILYLLKFEQEP